MTSLPASHTCAFGTLFNFYFVGEKIIDGENPLLNEQDYKFCKK